MTKIYQLTLLLLVAFTQTTIAQNIVINELMASNMAAVADENSEFDDWIELFNNSNASVDLSGWYLTDKTDNLTKFQLENGTTIDANGYLVIWADEDGSQGLLHANFKLSAIGETVMLLDSFQNVMDSVVFGQQTTDLSYARVPNGTGNFIIQPPTWSFSNDNVSTNKIENDQDFSLFPNPSKGFLTVEIKGKLETNMLEVLDNQGKRVAEFSINNNLLSVDASSWSNGLYIFRYGNIVKKLLILK